MRVLMITTSYPKAPGDVTAPVIEKIVFELARRGHAVDLVLPRHPDLVLEGRERGLPVRFFPFWAGGGRRMPGGMRRRCAPTATSAHERSRWRRLSSSRRLP
jgi:hypothetical protein